MKWSDKIKNDKRFYIYSILDNNGKCIYIGKGTGRRVIQSLKNKKGYDYKILINNITHKKSLELEASFINQIGINNLVNIRER